MPSAAQLALGAAFCSPCITWGLKPSHLLAAPLIAAQILPQSIGFVTSLYTAAFGKSPRCREEPIQKSNIQTTLEQFLEDTARVFTPAPPKRSFFSLPEKIPPLPTPPSLPTGGGKAPPLTLHPSPQG